MTPSKKSARIAGLLYLAMAILGAFSILYVPSLLVVPGDAAATSSNIMADESLYRLGILGGLACQVIFVFLVLQLHELLKGVSQKHASLMVALVVVSVPIACVNALSQFAALLVLGDPGYLAVLDPQQSSATVMFFLDLHARGMLIAQVFWGLWLLPLGLLVLRSGFIPGIFGVLLMIGCFAYVFAAVMHVLFPGYAASTDPIVASVSGIAEVSIIFWLLIKGVRTRKPGGASPVTVTSS